MKSVDLDAILALTNDFELCNRVFCCFANISNKIDVEASSEEERVVILTWHASGIIENGGFEYLFEGEFIGDSGFIYTAAAFKTIGAMESYSAFQRALAALGDSHLSNRDERLAAFLRLPKEERSAIDCQFWDDDETMRASLARYIRERRERFRLLLSPLLTD